MNCDIFCFDLLLMIVVGNFFVYCCIVFCILLFMNVLFGFGTIGVSVSS